MRVIILNYGKRTYVVKKVERGDLQKNYPVIFENP